MAFSGYSNESPVMILPSQQPFQTTYFSSEHYRPAQDAAASPSGLPTPRSIASQPPTPSEGAIAGRKRSRDDIFSPEDDHANEPTAAFQAACGDPTYGPGMTLGHPSDLSGHYNTDAGSQGSETVQRRPVLAARKSQRMNSAASRIEIPQESPRVPGTESVMDEAARLLGVSWSRMDATENTQVAQRAYNRWISRHYPGLTGVELWFENSAIPGYLGKATNTENGLEEYYLWSYDLHQAILVTRQPGDLVLKLSSPHMSVSQATDKIYADVQPVVEARAANAAILHNDRFIIDDEQIPGGMEVD